MNYEKNEMSSLVSMLLDTFQPKESLQSPSSLAKELQTIMKTILDGEIICLDDLEDKMLKKSIEKLFSIIGLTKEEMEDDDQETEDSRQEQRMIKQDNISYGFALPEPSKGSDGDDDNFVKIKLIKAIESTE